MSDEKPHTIELTEAEQASLTAYCADEAEKRNVTPAWVAYEIAQDPSLRAAAITYTRPVKSSVDN